MVGAAVLSLLEGLLQAGQACAKPKRVASAQLATGIKAMQVSSELAGAGCPQKYTETPNVIDAGCASV